MEHFIIFSEKFENAMTDKAHQQLFGAHLFGLPVILHTKHKKQQYTRRVITLLLPRFLFFKIIIQ